MTYTKKEHKVSVVKGILGAIPYAGTFLNEVIFEARSRIKQERVNSFIEEFGVYIEGVSDQFNFESIDSEQIGDVFEEIITSVSKTASNHKRKVFKQILLNQLSSQDIDTDETLRFINITNELTKSQLLILNAFNALSDNVLKYKVQIIELENEKQDIHNQISDIHSKYVESVGDDKRLSKLEERLKVIPRLIKKRRTALKTGKINPNSHKSFGLTREVYIIEVHDLIAKGLLFDFALKTQIIDPFVHFGITSLGRSFMNYISK